MHPRALHGSWLVAHNCSLCVGLVQAIVDYSIITILMKMIQSTLSLGGPVFLPSQLLCDHFMLSGGGDFQVMI